LKGSVKLQLSVLISLRHFSFPWRLAFTEQYFAG